jgi:N utilization substance protein B
MSERPLSEQPVGEVKPANKRGTARLAAVQAIYQMEIGGAQLGDVIEEFETYRLGKEIDGITFREADAHFFRDIVSGVIKEQRRIDPAVHLALEEDWPLKRIDVTLRAILRAGVYELIGRKDVPVRVVISEYIDVAKAFFSEDEPGIVNGVLDRLAREIRSDELA